MSQEHVIGTTGKKRGSGSTTLPADPPAFFASIRKPTLGCMDMLPNHTNVSSSSCLRQLNEDGSAIEGTCVSPPSNWMTTHQTTPPDSAASAPQQMSGQNPSDTPPFRGRSAAPDATARRWSTSENFRVPLPDKSNARVRRVFTQEEDEALIRGFEKLGSQWAQIARHPAFKNRRSSTDVRDRFRNAFPEEYARAGYKPRIKSSKRLERSREAQRISRGDVAMHRQIKPMRFDEMETALSTPNGASSNDADPSAPRNLTMEPSPLSPMSSYDVSPQGIMSASSPTTPMSESVVNMLALTPTTMIPSISPPLTPQGTAYSIPDLTIPTSAAVPIPTLPQSFNLQPPFSIPMSGPPFHSLGDDVYIPSNDAFVSPSLAGIFPDTTTTSFSMPAAAPAFPQAMAPQEPVPFAPSASLPLNTGGGGPLPESPAPHISTADVSLLSMMMMQTPSHILEQDPRAP